MRVGERPEGIERAIHVDIWEKRIPSRGSSQYKGPSNVQRIAGWSLLTVE